MENIQNKSALIPSDEIRSEELLAEQKFEAFITSLAHIIEKYGMRVLVNPVNPLRDGLPFKKCSEILRMAWTLTIF